MTVPASDTPAPEGAPPADQTPEVPAGETTHEEDPFAAIEGEPDVFPRDYVEKLRREGQSLRGRLREAEAKATQTGEDPFATWTPEQANGWKQFLAVAHENPAGAIAALIGEDGFGYTRDEAAALIAELYGEAPPEGDTPPPADDDPNRPLTQADLDRFYEQRRAQEAEATAQERELQGVYDKAKELGYQSNAEIGSREEFRFQRLLHLAAKKHGGDLQAAHEALVAEEHTAVQDYLAQAAKEASDLPTPTGSGSGGESGAVNKDWGKAEAAAQEFISHAVRS